MGTLSLIIVPSLMMSISNVVQCHASYPVKVRSHCEIYDCDLFLLTMGFIGVGDVVAVA